MKKKLITTLISTALITALFAGCGGNNSNTAPSRDEKKSSNTVVVYSPNQPEINNEIVNRFKAKTGIEVQLISGGTGELLKRVQSEKANPLGDVFFGGGAESLESFKDYFEPYTSSEDGTIDEKFKSPEHYWNGFTALPMVMIYNKKLVSEDKVPQSWDDLLKPEWKGKISYADPNKSGSSYTQMITMVTAKDGWDFINKYAANLNGKVESSSSHVPKKVSDGEYPIGVTLEEVAFRYINNGANVGVAYPKEGTSAVPDGVALIKGAKNAENAKKFIDFVLSKEIQETVVKNFKRRSVRNDVASPEGLKAIKDIPMVKYDFNSAAKNKSENLNKWKDIFIK
ncbi:ABC transporter substrate-binding protein [Clostridium ganghwense]|uniref:Extracellular solute-binding protein n=1 Tax=Clostridium ganghwense TaxID=312089 RepID=A0ABT4CQM4_9CLOT|nr:ABC transporter substrate-binding protein [Clostridium ganghwense]MCY6371361.1 extracellular solute-binding protein [Clostridium ganghwense]